MDEKLIRMLIQYKDEFDRAPENLSVGACAALLDLYINRLAGWSFGESSALGILSAIYDSGDAGERRDGQESRGSAMTLKQLHMAAALARRAERIRSRTPAAA